MSFSSETAAVEMRAASNATLLERPGAWRKHSSAWGASLLVHVGLLVLLGLLLPRQPQGADVEPDRTAGIVLAQPRQQRVEYFSAADSAPTTTSQGPTAQEVLEQVQPEVPDITGLLPALPSDGGRPNTSPGTLTDATSLLQGGGALGDIGQTTTQVFGVQGTGSKFVYVFDRSASMEGFGGRPLLEAKRELIQSLNSLKPTNQFQIVFYNERPTVFNPNPATPPELLFGTDTNKQEAQSFVGAIRGRGGTRHLEALQVALRMGPDVIFFLTDADEPQLTTEELDQIDRWNRAATTIHTIEFGVGDPRPGTNFLQRIAQRNQGEHVYRDVAQFDDR